MFAIIAAILLFIALFERALGPIDLVIAAWLCIALHLALGIGVPWRRT